MTTIHDEKDEVSEISAPLHHFPDTLDGLSIIDHLIGGTQSTYLVGNQEHQYVLKHGVGLNQMMVEILMNKLYEALDITVPKIKAYFKLPSDLAEKLKLKPNTLVQLAEFIHTSTEPNIDKIKKQAASDFVVHAFIGNIDVAKRDNFIESNDGRVYVIDAGSNFVYRALGEDRNENEAVVLEITSMLQYHKEWFQDLTREDIQTQIKNLISKRDVIEKTIWSVTKALEFPTYLQEKVISACSNRLDYLAQHYGFAVQRFAKRDKPAVLNETAAGVLTLRRNQDGGLFVLLSKNKDKGFCDNFGGNSHSEDIYLACTAQRAVKEKSHDVLIYSELELECAPFHDMVLINSGGAKNLYRMYFIIRDDDIDTDKMAAEEDVEHHWVPIEALAQGIENNALMIAEQKETIQVVDSKDQVIIVSPTLYDILKQRPVHILIGNLIKHQKMLNQHTQGVGLSIQHCQEEQSAYRPLTSPKQVRGDIIRTRLKQSKILADIKHHRHRLFQKSAQDNPKIESKVPMLSQSELHLKAVLGSSFMDFGSIEDNVRCFLKQFPVSGLTDDKKEIFIAQAVDMIENERRHPDRFFFYHGCDSSIAFAYTLYTNIYQILQADENLTTLRMDNPSFHKLMNISDFITYFTELGMGYINNNLVEYIPLAISANMFLFGNHLTSSSYSIGFYKDNAIVTRTNFVEMLSSSLKPMGVADSLIEQASKLLNRDPDKGSGALYQLSMPKDLIDNLVYPALSGGIVKKLNKKDACMIEIISLLESGQLSQDDITRIQIRFFARLDSNLESKCYRLGNPELALKTSFKKETCKLSQEIAYAILKNMHSSSLLNSKTALTRYLDEIMIQVGINPDKNFVDDELLYLLVKSERYDTIINILALYPEYKTKTLILKQKSYLITEHNEKDYNQPTLLNLMLEQKNAGYAICKIYGDRFYEDKSYDFDILSVLLALPTDKRYECAFFLRDQIKNGVHLSMVLEKLPDADRYQFAQQLKDKIRDGSELAEVLGKISDDVTRHQFAQQLKDKIRDGFELAEVLGKISDDVTRHHFAQQLKDKIRDGSELAEVLGKISDDVTRHQFAQQLKDKIRDGFELAQVLGEISDDVTRHQFADELKGKIRHCYGLVGVLAQISDDAKCYQYVVEFKNTILHGTHLARVLAHISDDAKRHQFADELKYKIRDGGELAQVLQQISDDDMRHQFTFDLKDKIQDVIGLRDVLKQLSYPVGLRLANDLIKNGSDLAYFLGYISDITKCHKYAHALKDKIQDGYQLAKVLAEISDNKMRFEFAVDLKDKITDDFQLEQVLEQLPEDVRSQFADLLNKIEDNRSSRP